jgi:tRNA uridine 5-carboxymethylaminomethyl modification enzyme
LSDRDLGRKGLPIDVVEEVETEAKYAGYVKQSMVVMARSNDSHDATKIPSDFDFQLIHGLSVEVREKLQKRKPETVAQARKMAGVTPAAVSLLLVHLKRQRQL